jgi:hypothetical protein
MAQIALQVEMVVDIPNSSITASVQKVTDSMGQDRTTDFINFATSRKLSITSQSEIENAVLEYVKHNATSLP